MSDDRQRNNIYGRACVWNVERAPGCTLNVGRLNVLATVRGESIRVGIGFICHLRVGELKEGHRREDVRIQKSNWADHLIATSDR